MRLSLFALLATVAGSLSLSPGLVEAVKKANTVSNLPRPRPELVLPGLGGRYDRFLQRAFDQADTDNDGRMNLTDTYEWILRLYIQINRHAPVDPPSLPRVKDLIRAADENHDDYITREEFKDLAELCARRASVRIAANKFITLIVAPFLAEGVLQWFKKQIWLYEKVVVPYVADRLIPIVTNPVIWRTVLTVIFVSTLGNIVMETVNDLLDARLKRIEEKQQQKAAAAEHNKKRR